MHPARPVSALMVRLEPTHLAEQCQVRYRRHSRRLAASVVIAAARPAEFTEHDIYRPSECMLLDRGELHRNVSAKMPATDLVCRAPSTLGLIRGAAALSRTFDPLAAPSSILAASPPDLRRALPSVNCVPTTQHCRYNTQSARRLGVQTIARLPLRVLLSLKLVGEPMFCLTRHHKSLEPAEPITGGRQTEQRSLAAGWRRAHANGRVSTQPFANLLRARPKRNSTKAKGCAPAIGHSSREALAAGACLS